MNVVMLSPGFPFEQSYFTRALARAGATVIGVGDQPIKIFNEPIDELHDRLGER